LLRRTTLGSLPFLLIALTIGGLEVRHYIRFHDLCGYGWHADLLKRSVDIGIPGIKTEYALWLTNDSIRPQTFEGIQLPGGYVGSGVIYRDRIERWDAKQRSWVTIREAVRSDMAGYPLVTQRVWPGQSVLASGWDAIAAMDGISKGDSIRIVVLSSFDNGAAGKGLRTFYSSDFSIDEEPTRPVDR
jgi:hypothetical protein